MVDTTEARIAPSWQDRLENDAYKNWLKVGYGMHVVCTGIRPYIERESKAFHGSLLTKAMAPCTCVHVPSRRPNAFHDMAVCDWAKDLKHHHTKRKPTWSQSEGSKWTDPNVGHWEVAKVYMPFGCAHGKTSAQETDATGLLNLLQFCDHYVVDRTSVDAFKTTRNKWAHASQQELTDDQTNDAFTSMKDLLNDAEFLADTDAMEALGKITDLELETLVEFEENIAGIVEVVNEDLKEYMETILQKLNSLKEQEDANANNIIDEIREVKQILKSKASVWKNCCKCFHAAWTFLKAMPKQLVVILILLSCSLWLNNDTEEIGCLSNINFDYLELKQFDFTEYLHSARQDFVGRQWLFKKLTDTLRNSNNTENGFLIIASPGFGKSSLMSNLICTKSSSHSINTQILGYHFCIYSDKTTTKSGKIVQNLANMIAFRIRPYKDLLSKNSFLQRVLKMECTSDPSGCFQQAILTPLITLSNDYNFFREMYIVVDALDECIDENESDKDASIINILGKKSRRFPKWLKVIATARNVSSIKRQLKHFNQIELFQEDQRNLRDIQDFLTWKFIAFNETIISKMVNQSQGNFLYIRLVSEHIEQNWFNTEEWKSLPASIESAYQDFFDRKFGSVEKFRAARKICEILVSTLHPLTVAEIYDILHFENKDFQYEYNFMRILDDFSDYLRYTGENKYLSFFHSSLQEWLTSDTNRGGKYFVDQVNGNQLLAQYFLQKVNSVPVSVQFVYQLATYIVRGGNRTHLVNRFLNIDPKLLTTADTATNMTALHLAAGDGDDRLLKLFLNIFKNLDIVDGKGRTPLFYAVRSDLINNVRELHILGASCHVITRLQRQEEGTSEKGQINDCELQMCGYNLLHVAAQKGHHKILKYLLENNIAISIMSGTKEKAIHIAAKFGHIEILNTLVEHGETLDHVCFYNAVSRRQLSAVKFLLQHGIKDECRSCEISAKQNVPYQRSCNTALHIAAIEGFQEIADLLLNKSEVNALTCVNLFCREPLHEAIRNNNYQVAKVLLRSGANPSSLCSRRIHTDHMTKEEVDEICPCGFSSLHIAAYYRFPEITELLLQYKADYNAGDCDDMQPIHIAACRGHGDVLSVLVKNGVDINSKNSKGMTATHYACKCTKGHIFETLAALGADGYAVTTDKRLPLDFIFPHFKFNSELFQFADSYVQNPIDPIDFSAMYSVEKKSGSAWNKIWTKFLIKFPISEQQELDAVRDITFKVTVEQYKEIFASNVPQMIFASHWFSYPLASVITSVNHNLDVSMALRQLNAANKGIFTIFWQDNPSDCARLIEKIHANMVYATDVLLSYVINVNCETSGLTPILAYLKTGGRHMAKVLAKHVVKINIKCWEKFENSTLHLAAYHKLHYLHYLTIFQDPDEWEKYLQTKDALFDYLFDEYENVSKEGTSRIERVRDGPVTKAIKSHPEGFKIIDNCMDDEGYTALHRAAQGGNVVAVKHFLDWGANLSIKTRDTEFDPLVLTIRYAIKYRPHYNFHKPSNLTSLEIDFASLTANVILDYLTKNKPLNIGCDKQKTTPTILHLAATRGMWRFIEKLFVARNQSKVVGLDANCPTKHGITPLYLAKVYGGSDCQWDNPWCKVIDVLLKYGGTEKILPQIATEYYVILNFMFHQLPRQLDLESDVKKTLQDSLSLYMYKDCEPDVFWDNIMQQPEPLFEEINDFISSIKTAKEKHNELDGNGHMCASLTDMAMRHMFVYESKERSTPSTPQDIELQSQKAQKNSNGHAREELPKCGSVPFIHMFCGTLSFCSELFTEDIKSVELELHHNYKSFLGRYRKYNMEIKIQKAAMEIIKAAYYDYSEKENEKIRKYENQARCRFGKATYVFARKKFLLKTVKHWNHQVNEMSKGLRSISAYMLQKLGLILSDDRQKMTELILQLAQEDSVVDHEYLKMLRFSKAPMYDRTMYDKNDV